MYPVRNSIKAIIIRNNKVLCVRKTDEFGYFYVLPGGGQEKDETFVEAVVRECKEEIGADVKVGKLRYIREYIGKNHEFREVDANHQVEFMFECDLMEEPNSEKASNQDEGQNGIEWIDIDAHKENRVYPKVLIRRLSVEYDDLYWGDIN